MVIIIQPDFSFEDTSHIVGDILGLSLEFDNSGYFEEFPAYSSPRGDTRFALLAPPDPKFMGHTQWHDYELQVYKFPGTVQSRGSQRPSGVRLAFGPHRPRVAALFVRRRLRVRIYVRPCPTP